MKHYKIDKNKCKDILLNGYSLHVRELNPILFRISSEESNDYWDWFHTTGTVVETIKGYYKNIGKFPDVEELALLIKSRIV